MNSTEDIFGKPFAEIEKAAGIINEAEGSLTEEQVSYLYSSITSEAGKAMDTARQTITDTLASLKNSLGEDSEEYKAFAENFTKGGETITKALEMTGAALVTMANPTTIEQGKKELEIASAALQQGFLHLQSSGAFLSSDSPEYPIDITEPAEHLEHVSENIDIYLESGDIEKLKEAVYNLRNAELSLIEKIEEYEGIPFGESPESTNLQEILDYGTQQNPEYEEAEDEDFEEDYEEDEDESEESVPEQLDTSIDSATINSYPQESEGNAE